VGTVHEKTLVQEKSIPLSNANHTLGSRECKCRLRLYKYQALWASNRSQRGTFDNGSCTEEPRDRETITRGSDMTLTLHLLTNEL
jgi:hypothetical protein